MNKKEYIQKLKEEDFSLLRFLIGKLLKGMISNKVFSNTQGTHFEFINEVIFSSLNENEVLSFSNEYDETDGLEDIYYPILKLTENYSSIDNSYIQITPTFFYSKKY